MCFASWHRAARWQELGWATALEMKQSKCLELLPCRCWLRGSCLELIAKVEVLKVYLDLLSCQPLLFKNFAMEQATASLKLRTMFKPCFCMLLFTLLHSRWFGNWWNISITQPSLSATLGATQYAAFELAHAFGNYKIYFDLYAHTISYICTIKWITHI